MLEFLKANLKWVIILFIVLFLFFQIRGCREAKLNYEIGRLEAKVEAGEAALLVKDKFMEKAQKEHDEKIAELNGMIDSAQTVIMNLEGKDKELAGALQGLETAELTLIEKGELIVNLRSQISIWRERFDLSQKTIAEKDKIIFSLTEKYESEHRLRLEISADKESWKVQYFELKGLNDFYQDQIKKQKRESRLERIGMGVLAGLAAYVILK